LLSGVVLKLYTVFPNQPLENQSVYVDKALERGYAGVWATENHYDPFLHIAAAVRKSRLIELGTGVTTLLVRHPVTVAQMSWELHFATSEHFILGVGTQLDVHLRTRFGLDTKDKQARLHEAIHLIREMWQSWTEDREPYFDGAYFKVTHCPPAFRPTARLKTHPRIFLLCVNEKDLNIAINGFDGIFTHPTWSPRVVHHFAKLINTNKSFDKFQIISGGIIATGQCEATLEESRVSARKRILDYWLQQRYDGIFKFSGVMDTILWFRDLASNSNIDWDDPALRILYNTFVCDALIDKLDYQIELHHSAKVDGLFPNIVSNMPDLLPAEIVANISRIRGQAEFG
jgi:hypothetical protein